MLRIHLNTDLKSQLPAILAALDVLRAEDINAHFFLEAEESETTLANEQHFEERFLTEADIKALMIALHIDEALYMETRTNKSLLHYTLADFEKKPNVFIRNWHRFIAGMFIPPIIMSGIFGALFAFSVIAPPFGFGLLLATAFVAAATLAVTAVIAVTIYVVKTLHENATYKKHQADINSREDAVKNAINEVRRETIIKKALLEEAQAKEIVEQAERINAEMSAANSKWVAALETLEEITQSCINENIRKEVIEIIDAAYSAAMIQLEGLGITQEPAVQYVCNELKNLYTAKFEERKKAILNDCAPDPQDRVQQEKVAVAKLSREMEVAFEQKTTPLALEEIQDLLAKAAEKNSEKPKVGFAAVLGVFADINSAIKGPPEVEPTPGLIDSASQPINSPH